MPTNISYIIIPKVHQSTPLPWPTLVKTSGAKYSGVPQSVNVLLSTTFANPKSVNFKYPSGQINKFSGFKSLYTTFFECKYSNAKVIWDA